MRVYFDREHVEEFCHEACIGNTIIRNLKRSFNKDFILAKVKIGVAFEDELQNLVIVRSWVVFFDDFVVDFQSFIVLRWNLIIHLNFICLAVSF